MRIVIKLSIIALISTVVLPVQPQRSTTSQTHSNKLGVHLLLDDGRQNWPQELWPQHMDAAANIFGQEAYVLQLVRSDDLDIEKWNYFMALATERKLKPIIRLATTFDRENGWWQRPPADTDGSYTSIASAYATFLAELNWPTTPLIIVGNEPNHGTEWGGRPDPAQYAAFLHDTATAIHDQLPSAIVMNAPVDHYAPHTGDIPFNNGIYYMDAESFLDGMVAADPQIFTVIDAWASHPYPMGAFIAPPWEQSFGIDYLHGANNANALEPLENMYNRGINAYEWELYKLASYGVEPLPVYITETGWRHHAMRPNTYPNYPSPALAAQYIDLALWGNNGRYPDLPNSGWTPWAYDVRVVAVIFFALNGHPSEWEHTNWLQMSADGDVLDFWPSTDWPLTQPLSVPQ